MYSRRDSSAARPPPDDRPISIDAMLDMERREVLALLENKTQPTAAANNVERRSASPYAVARSPVRSMLDIGPEPSSPTTRTSPGTQAPVRSMLDMDSPLPAVSRTRSIGGNNTVPSSPSSPLATTFMERSPSQSSHYRKRSDASYKPVEFGPRATANRNEPSGYQFSGIYNTLGPTSQQMPLRAAQRDPSLAKKSGPSSLGEALRSSDLSNLVLPGERGRKASGGVPSRLSGGSRSPHNRLTSRSRSPATFSSKLGSGKAYLNDGQVVDLNNAYRRMTDANLATSGGSLSQLPKKKKTQAGEGRLIKDYLGPDGEHLGSSEDEEPFSTDDEDRGRTKTPRPLNSDATGISHSLSRSRSPEVKRKSLSLLAAAEEERKCHVC